MDYDEIIVSANEDFLSYTHTRSNKSNKSKEQLLNEKELFEFHLWLEKQSEKKSNVDIDIDME